MLLLIVSHRDKVRLVEEDIRRHESGVSEQTAVDVFRVLGGLILKLGHPAELAEHSIAVEDPAQLRMLVNMGLNEESVLLRIQAAGNILSQLLQGPPPQSRRLLPHCDGVHIGHKIVAVELLGPGAPVTDGPQIVAQMQVSAGLDAGEHDFFLIHSVTLLLFLS